MEPAATRIKYPPVLEELAACISATLFDEGIDIGEARRCSIAVVERVRSHNMWGGQKIYIPSGKAADVAEMRRDVARRWDGRNTHELCREFGISESRLRQLVREAQPKCRTS